ncbi:MAG: PfkB family carbohydrate kinase [Herbinix sp.]|nr:PfkB family carbohydrate kinase [Herbinix sp.]
MKVLGFGDCCVDYYINKQIAYPGGNALNVAVFAHENGADAAFLGTIGNDIISEHICKCAKLKGIDISHCSLKNGSTGKAAVNIIEGNRVFDANYFGDSHGVGTLFPPILSESDIDYMKEFDLIHASCYAHIENQFDKLKNMESLLTFDFSSEDKYRIDEYLKKVCPKLDVALFSGEHLNNQEITELAQRTKEFGCRNVLITMGAKGQRLYTENSLYEGKIVEIEPVDTMGAGDSFFAAFLVGLLKRGWNKNIQISEDMAISSLREAASYSAQNCLVEGSFGYGLQIDL